MFSWLKQLSNKLFNREAEEELWLPEYEFEVVEPTPKKKTKKKTVNGRFGSQKKASPKKKTKSKSKKG